MQFELPTIARPLNAKLARLSEIYQALAKQSNPDLILRDAARLFFMERGVDSAQYTHSHWLKYQTKLETYMLELVGEYRNDIFPTWDLKLIKLQHHYVVVTDSEIMAIGAYQRAAPNYVAMRWFGYEPLIEALKACLQEREGPIPESFQRFYVDDRDTLRDKTIVPPPFVPLKHFALAYPYLKQTPEEFWDAFKASANNVTILIGGPGTGKSSFLRNVMLARGVSGEPDTFMADSVTTIGHRSFMERVRDLPSGSVMLTEDSDMMLEKRDNGNKEMSTLLNATSGVAATDTKFFISTNLSTTAKIDSALLRRGRLFQVLEFRNLKVEEAMALRDAMDLPPVDMTGFTNGVPLADALSINDDDVEVRKNRTFGFNQ